MPKAPYRIARQAHLGDMLDQLQRLGLLTWEWDYAVRSGRKTGSAVYWITEPGQRRRRLGTKQAEDLALKLCVRQGIAWLPVPAPGGERQLAETRRQIQQLKRGIQSGHDDTSSLDRA